MIPALATHEPPFIDGPIAALAVVMGFVLFAGSVYVILSAVFGRRMGYLILAVSFFSWMILLSLMWVVRIPGVVSTNLGPRGSEPGWRAVTAGLEPGSEAYPAFDRYPGGPWREPTEAIASSVQSVQGAIQEFLAEEANHELGLEEEEEGAVAPEDFVIEDIRFTAADDTSLAAGRAYYSGGGPLVSVLAYHDSGSVPVYSWSFLIASVVGLAIHAPFLDRAERRRKEILTGGTAPAWYGPA